ncbi:hypothetical protein [Streptantibioticus silvisoli]|jgi:hypothetical protein|uniref:Uncharacterized protein n=1 Tax=Streptantibioticus silvisoli TaxID=2705255 RepID=A0ABT6W0H7_9ACTN|nr:hypothetical protein [Streptantibioticus silvisoli]MDI5963467.1 hypothetical protein [Streptantibioticus silvisoli]
MQRSLRRRIISSAAVLGAAAMLLAGTAGVSEAAPRQAAPQHVTPADDPPGTAVTTFTDNTTGHVYTCRVYTPTGIGAPNPPLHGASWTGVASCDLSLRMQGASAVYVWGQSIAYYPGSSYDDTAYTNSTTGTVVLYTGPAWGINNNVLFFAPPNTTATPGAGCYTQAAGQIHCTATTGPFSVS